MLPLVEFVVDSSLTDEEAVSILDLYLSVCVIFQCLCFALTEVLPLVEFVLDSSLTDEEAVSILDLYLSVCVIFQCLCSTLTEVLPLVEFVLDSSLTDEEAVSILDLSIPKPKKSEKGNWQEGRLGRIFCLHHVIE